MGIGWRDALEEINLNLQDLGNSRNSGRKGNDVLSATEVNTASRGWGGMCDWRKGKAILRSRYDRVKRSAKGNESGASLSWLALNAPAHKHRICIALVLSRLLLPCPLSFFSP